MFLLDFITYPFNLLLFLGLYKEDYLEIFDCVL